MDLTLSSYDSDSGVTRHGAPRSSEFLPEQPLFAGNGHGTFLSLRWLFYDDSLSIPQDTTDITLITWHLYCVIRSRYLLLSSIEY